MSKRKGVYLLFIWSIIFAFLSLKLFHQPRFDYGFHAARIVGLAQSIRNVDVLPNLNFIFSYGIGYATPMFYGNWMLYLPALVYILTKSVFVAYSAYSYLILFTTMVVGFFVYDDISQKRKASLLWAGITPVFFYFYSFGMTSVVPLCLLLIHALYKILYKQQNSFIYLGVVTALLIQSHVLSTLILAIYALVFCLFSIRQLSKQSIVTFVKATVLALLLSIGYLVQFIEQVKSQVFFYKWNFRDFPKTSEAMFMAKSVWNTLIENVDYGGFTPLSTPLLSLLSFVFFIWLLKSKWWKKEGLGNTLAKLSITIFLLTTNIINWKLLQGSILGALQYPYRLLFFLPVVVIIIFLTSLKDKMLYYMAGAGMLFYISSAVIETTIDWQWIANNNKNYLAVYRGNETTFINPIGDEYYTIDVDNQAIRQPAIAQFRNLSNVSISNIKKSYNRLEFDVALNENTTKGSLTIPKVWYLGYQASYVNGAKGSQPTLRTVPLTDEEVAENQRVKKPSSSQKVLDNGLISLEIYSKGKVIVEYRKTFLQKLFLALEAVLWIVVLLWGMIGVYKNHHLKQTES